MITRIVQHNNMSLQNGEDYILKFEGNLVKITNKSELISGITQDLHKELVEIFENSSFFCLEEIPVRYNVGTMQSLKDKFEYYIGIELGMIYCDIIGNPGKHGWYGERYSITSIQNNKPPVSFVNKKICPGIPISLDQKLLMDIAQKAPILYCPGEYIQAI